jgi:hypothetical protein
MKFAATALSILNTISITAALRGNKNTHDDTIHGDNDLAMQVPMEAEGFGIEIMDEDFGARHSRHLTSYALAKGTLDTMVVRINDSSGDEPPYNEEEILESFYGDDLSFKSIVEGCSYNNLNIEPSSQKPNYYSSADPPIPGVYDITIGTKVEGATRDIVLSKARTEMQEKYGWNYLNKFDVIIYCFPEGSTRSDGSNWSAAGSGNDMILNGDYCTSIPALMFQFGLILGLDTSYEGDTNVVDTIGHMDGRINLVGYNKRCYNAVNSYQLDWYTGQYGDFNEFDLLNPTGLEPVSWGPATQIQLYGISKYKDDGSNGVNSFVSLRIENIDGDDYYIGYNFKNGINSETANAENKITIHQKPNAGPYESGYSTLVKTLGSRTTNIFSGAFNRPPAHTFRVGSSIVTLTSGFSGVGSIYAYLTARSLMESVKVTDFLSSGIPSVLSSGHQTYALDADYNDDEYMGTGIVTVRIIHEGEIGGSDWYIQKDDDQIRLLEKTSGPYESGTSEVIATLDLNPVLGADHTWRVGGTLVTLKAIWPSFIRLSAIDSPTDSPTTSPTIRPTAPPTPLPTPPPTPTPTKGPTPLPTPRPTAGPTSTPTPFPTSAPTAGPTSAPTLKPTVDCTDNLTKEFDIEVNGTTETKNCAFVASEKKARRKEFCKMEVEVNGNSKYLKTICKETCGLVGKGVCKHLTAEPTSSPTAGPTSAPTSSPTANPTSGPTLAPTRSPTTAPTAGPTSAPTLKPTVDCTDNLTKQFDIEVDGNTKSKNCDWLASKKESKQQEYCAMKVEVNGNSKNLSAICKKTCGLAGLGQCTHLTAGPTSAPTPSPTENPTSGPTFEPTIDCADNLTKEFDVEVNGTAETKNCAFVASEKKAQRKEFCMMEVEVNGNSKYLKTICKETCGLVGKGVCKHLKDL